MARYLISGADVWLNTPRRPFEASGTSGQKVSVHGGLNLSVLDGWWREGFDGTNGWPIGGDTSPEDPEAQDAMDADAVMIVEAPDITAAARLFQDHPHITIFPGDGIDVMPVVSGPPEETQT